MIISWVQDSILHIYQFRNFEVELGAKVIYRLPQQFLVYLLSLLVVGQSHHITPFVNL